MKIDIIFEILRHSRVLISTIIDFCNHTPFHDKGIKITRSRQPIRGQHFGGEFGTLSARCTFLVLSVQLRSTFPTHCFYFR